jgi:hypothetical protein
MRSPAPSIGSHRQSEDVMIEAYSFLAMFLLQILVMSVLYPYRLSRAIQTGLERIPADRLAEHYPGVDVGRAHERFLTRYRVANAVVVVLGLLLLGWFFSYMNRPDWDEGWVGGMLTVYFFLQNFPIILIAWFTTRFKKLHGRSAPESRRKASLQRRGLFDFVSPLAVVLAVLSFASFAAFMFYVARHPFPGFAGPLVNIGVVTLGFVLLGFVVYRQIYGRKTDPLQTHADRVRTIGVIVNTIVWMCIVLPIILSLSIGRQMFELDTWGPFTGSVVFLLIGLLSFRALSAPPRQPEADEPGSSPAHQ